MAVVVAAGAAVAVVAAVVVADVWELPGAAANAGPVWADS